jgi:hypothetical protein
VANRKSVAYHIGRVLTEIVGFGAILYAASIAADRGWTSPETFTWFAIGAAGLVLFTVVELFWAKAPLLDLRLFSNRIFLNASLLGYVSTIALFGAEFLLPIYLQALRGLTALQTGLILLPMALTGGIFVTLSGRIYDRVGPRPLMAVGFATPPYFGVNSFKFTNAKGDSTVVRYRMLPEGGAEYLTKEQLAEAGPNYLAEEIRKRVGGGPVRMKLQVQLAEPGDKIDDPSIAWPDSRKTVELGVVEIDKVDPDSDAAQRALLFLENAVPVGIETADPMIDIRSQAYAVSFARRHATAAQ